MEQNELLLFDKFKPNTDAVQTNRGFLYQYLKTLKSWLISAIDESGNVIYCETEDDIKEVNSKLHTIKFTQIKCYSSNLGTNDEEIEKSIYNFFILSNIYSKYNGTFLFETNTKIKRNDNLLKEWCQNQEDMSPEIFKKCKYRVAEVILKVIEQKKESAIKALNNKIDELKKKDEDFTVELKELETKITVTEQEYTLLINKIKSEAFLEAFTKSIKWVFEKVEGETAVQLLKEECLALLKQYINSYSFLLLTRLLSEIYFRSCNTEVEERRLDKQLLDKIIDESEEEMLKRTDQDIKNSLQEISGKLEEMHRFMGREFDYIKERLPEKPILSPVLYDLPFYDGKKIDSFLSIESNSNQSKLESKIKKMNLQEDDESDLIAIATRFRCRYLLYLEQLQLNGLETEYNELKSLEETVKHECFEAKLMIEDEENFNSFRFWTEFKKKLELFAKSKKIDDSSIVHAQMYQMAAECPLRWNKVGS
ncbi:hypothetical protein CN326_21545 [Bacillus sp. AFS018417]|uniref:coiled-coil domain-containing protein n=1 Tax=Bacillus sp. AFS018417 TaxID=2033491 RepID=UPI000BF43847|nr:hypothetical protein [Bacillus sp. AFS018417]PEZ01338.1 hypothetical protein CN326_21545 [Bacillus sp. AFS018417]